MTAYPLILVKRSAFSLSSPASPPSFVTLPLPRVDYPALLFPGSWLPWPPLLSPLPPFPSASLSSAALLLLSAPRGFYPPACIFFFLLPPASRPAGSYALRTLAHLACTPDACAALFRLGAAERATALVQARGRAKEGCDYVGVGEGRSLQDKDETNHFGGGCRAALSGARRTAAATSARRGRSVKCVTQLMCAVGHATISPWHGKRSEAELGRGRSRGKGKGEGVRVQATASEADLLRFGHQRRPPFSCSAFSSLLPQRLAPPPPPRPPPSPPPPC